MEHVAAGLELSVDVVLAADGADLVRADFHVGGVTGVGDA